MSVLQILMAAQFDNLHQSLFSSGSTRKRPTNGTRFVKRNIESGQRGLINIKALVGNIWEAGTDCSVALQLRNMKRDDLQIREGFQYSDNPQCQSRILDHHKRNNWRRNTWDVHEIHHECSDFVPYWDPNNDNDLRVVQFRMKLWPGCIDHLLLRQLHVTYDLGKERLRYSWYGYHWFSPTSGWSFFDTCDYDDGPYIFSGNLPRPAWL